MEKDIKAWTLPWTAENVPHATLDVIRGCDISCPACYNTAKPRHKPLDEIKLELDRLMELRVLDSLSVVGGEVALHPQLAEIVEEIKSRGLSVELFTNGLSLDAELAGKLAASGVDVAFLHIEPGQKRPDLPETATFDDCLALLRAKTNLLAEAGIEGGLSFTARDATEAAEYAWKALGIKGLYYILITLHANVANYPEIRGNIASGMRAENASSAGDAAGKGGRASIRGMRDAFASRFGLAPFAAVPSNRDNREFRWLSYLVATVHRRDGSVKREGITASLAEKCFLKLHFALKKHYPFYSRQNPAAFKAQLLFNAFSGGGSRASSAFYASLSHGSETAAKRILCQRLAEVADDGSVVHCSNCPDAVLKNGELVPLCISDKVVAAKNEPGGLDIDTDMSRADSNIAGNGKK